MRGLFVDATPEMAATLRRVRRAGDPDVAVNLDYDLRSETLPQLLAGFDFAMNDHTQMPTAVMARCAGLRHVVFLGTGVRSYMRPEELTALGLGVHTIRGYGDTAVAEHAVALMWAAARSIGAMHGAVRAGGWPRTEGMQLTGKTLGLLGFGGIAAEMARIAGGGGMRVLAWNRTPRTAAGVAFVDLDTLLADSDVLSVHLLLTEETRGFLSAERIARMRPGAILVNTARGALVDEAAMLAALGDGRLRHAALDVFHTEPLPAGHALTALENVTLSAHSAFRTPEAAETLLRRALDIAGTLRNTPA